MPNEQISLYFSEGSSDKEYHAELVAQGDGYLVHFRYGRRGSALTSGTKTATPIAYDKAKAAYDKLVKEKLGKGYSPGTAGTAYQATPLESRFTGFVPQLLNPVDDAGLERLLEDPRFALQEKLDGKRLLVHRQNDTLEGINRRGLVVALPAEVARVVGRFPAPTLLDGELVGDVFHVFDLLLCRGDDYRTKPYESRLQRLIELLGAPGVTRFEPNGPVRPVPVVTGAAAKRQCVATCRDEGREGVVFKDLAAPYTVGRPASGGTQFKYKFTESATCRVKARHASKRSVALELQTDTGTWVGVGNVTVPANHPIPTAGAIVEVQYLYAYPGGSLYQPVYRGLREDQPETACLVSQLKFKASSSEDEDAE